MPHSFAVGRTPVKTFERLIAKLFKLGREYRLYGKQKSTREYDFYLRDNNGEIINSWKNANVRDIVSNLKSNGFSLKTNENKLYRKEVCEDDELIKCAKQLRSALNEDGILHSRNNHHTTVCSTLFIDSQTLTEDLSSKRKEFIQSLERLDQFDSLQIKIGAKVSIISAQLQGDYVEIWGFTTPKQITKITRDPNDNSIKQFEFNNNPNDVWPKADNAEYKGRFLFYSAFFGSKQDANRALTMLTLQAPEGLNIRSHVKEHKGSTMNTNEELMNEDHFSPDEVAAIKSCEDGRVKDFYREYVRAEAIGDMSRADMMAQLIKDRCEMLGITVRPQMSEEPCGECGVPAFESWEARMKAAGAKRFDEDAADAMVRAIKVVEGKDFVLGEFDKALDAEVFEDKASLYAEYTMDGSDDEHTVWMEKVTAEGATSIKKVGYTEIAFIGESRLGRFTPTTKERKIKSFNQIISESASTKEPLYEPLKFPTAQTSATNIVDILKLSGLKLDEAWANAPDEKVADAETQLISMSGGLNRKKKQVNPDNPADNPLTMKKPAKAGFLNIEEEELAESLEAEFKKFIPEAAEVTEEQDEQVNESGFENDPYGQGYAAGYKGHSAERCPYGPGTPEKDQWYSGWQDGREEMRYKSREDYSDIDRSSPYESKDLSVYANKVVAENVEYDGNIGDEVIITGNVQFNGATGVISDFGQDRRFVIVDLYNHGKKSFHASDVSINDYADSEEERSDWEYEDDVPEFMGKRGLGEDENNTAGIWQDVINAIAMGYPDIDPVDSLKSVMRKHNIRDFGFFDQLARKNGYSDIYAVADEFMSESKEGKQYTGRETKDGVWRVFEKGKSVAVAGPFDSAEEANKWIKDKTTVNESDDDDDEEWYDKDGRPSKSGAYDAGGHYHKERDTDKDDLTESVNALKKLSGLL